MSRKKNRQREANARTGQGQSSGRSVTAWALPLGVLVVGLLAILAASGVFEADDVPSAANVPASSTPPTPAATKPATLATSGEIPSLSERDWNSIDNPEDDGWETEVLHTRIKKKLAKLGDLIRSESPPTAESFSSLLTANSSFSPLRGEVATAYDESGITVVRGVRSSRGLPSRDTTTFNGPQGFADAVADLRSPLEDATDLRFEFKVTRVTPDRGGEESAAAPIVELRTEQNFSLSGRTLRGMVEQHATWEAIWTVDQDGAIQLRTVAVRDFEETRTDQPSGPLFADVTASVLGKNKSYREQILRGANHWLERMPFRSLLTTISSPGIAVGDVNGDGLDDLFLCQEPGLPNRLYVQQPDGSAKDVSAAWSVDWINDSRSALLVDLDNDGDQDLVVATPANLVLAENEGNQSFRVQTTLPTSEDPSSLVAFDYDLDGRLDLYICAYYPDQLLGTAEGAAIGIARAETVFHDANDAAANSLFRNEIPIGGDWQFADVTKTTGIDANNRRWSLSASCEDYDNDGDGDLYVANDYGRDNLYRNDLTADGRRVFVDVGAELGAEQAANGMSVTWGDYNRDGWMDAYISNMWSSAGHRVAWQERFMRHASDEVRDRVRHFAIGNTLLQNEGGDRFADQSLDAGVNRGRWAWGSQFADLNNDGAEDLIIANGYITTEDTGDL